MLVETANPQIAAGPPRARVAAAPAPVPATAQVTAQAKRPAEPARGAETARAEATAETSSRSRLAYDDELSRLFIEIVDPDSGEVVHRFPPEQLVRHINELIEENQLPGNRDGTGVLFDQSV